MKGSKIVKSAFSSLRQQQKASASTAEDWLQSFVHDSQKQAAVSKEAFRVSSFPLHNVHRHPCPTIFKH